MKKKTRIGLIVILTAILVLALTIPGLAKKQTNFNLAYEYQNIDWDHNYGVGVFSSTGEIEVNDGIATLHWIPRAGVKQGTMFFEDPNGSFVVRYTISKDIGNYCGSGHFQIITFRGTGDYKTMWGGGDIILCRPDWGNDVNGTLSGWVNFE